MKAAAILAVLAGCAGGEDSAKTAANMPLVPDLPTRIGAACKPGADTWAVPLGLASIEERMRIAATPDGGAVVAASSLGLRKLDRTGAIQWTYPHGVAVAVSPEGAIYTAYPAANGSDAVIDRVLGGQRIWSVTVPLCAGGAQSLAIAADGRIAVAGSDATAILDADGNVLVTRPYGGSVAFSGDALVVAGTGYAALLDPSGSEIWNQAEPGAVFNGVATEHGDIALAGTVAGTASVFGTQITSHDTEGGRWSGGFAAKLDHAGRPQYLTQLDRDANGIALAFDGSAVVAGDDLGNLGFARIVNVAGLAADGQISWIQDMSPASGYGIALDAAAGECGSFIAAIALDTPVPGSPNRAYAIRM